MWDNSHDLTAAVDALAVYRATKVISRRQEAAGRLYAMGRRATFGGVFPISTVLARMVATSLPRGHEQAADWANRSPMTSARSGRSRLKRAIGRPIAGCCGGVVRRCVRLSGWCVWTATDPGQSRAAPAARAAIPGGLVEHAEDEEMSEPTQYPVRDGGRRPNIHIPECPVFCRSSGCTLLFFRWPSRS